MQFSLDKVDGMPQPVGDWAAVVGNPLIWEQHAYDQEEQGHLAAERIPTLNVEQRAAFDQIAHAVEQQTRQSFFLHGPGGTGKTYMYNNYATIFGAREKLFFVLPPRALHLCCYWVVRPHIPHSVFLPLFTNPLHAQYPSSQTWQSLFGRHHWLSGMKLQCSTGTSMKQ